MAPRDRDRMTAEEQREFMRGSDRGGESDRGGVSDSIRASSNIRSKDKEQTQEQEKMNPSTKPTGPFGKIERRMANCDLKLIFPIENSYLADGVIRDSPHSFLAELGDIEREVIGQSNSGEMFNGLRDVDDPISISASSDYIKDYNEFEDVFSSEFRNFIIVNLKTDYLTSEGYSFIGEQVHNISFIGRKLDLGVLLREGVFETGDVSGNFVGISRPFADCTLNVYVPTNSDNVQGALDSSPRDEDFVERLEVLEEEVSRDLSIENLSYDISSYDGENNDFVVKYSTNQNTMSAFFLDYILGLIYGESLTRTDKDWFIAMG